MASQFMEKTNKNNFKVYFSDSYKRKKYILLLKECHNNIIMIIFRYEFNLWIKTYFVILKLDDLPSIGFVQPPLANQVLNSNIRYESCTLQIYKVL